MTAYTTYESLKGNTLEYGDVVNIYGIQHIVLMNGLDAELCEDERIFHLLDLDRYSVASKVYGQRCNSAGDMFPKAPGDCSRSKSMDCLTRLCLVLLGLSEGMKSVTVTVHNAPVTIVASSRAILPKELCWHRINEEYYGHIDREGMMIVSATLQQNVDEMEQILLSEQKSGKFLNFELFGYNVKRLNSKRIKIGCQEVAEASLWNIIDAWKKIKR